MRMLPWSGTSSVASMSSRVVLPEPLGPISAVTSPGCAVRLMLSTASTSPNARRTPWTSMLMRRRLVRIEPPSALRFGTHPRSW